ncbi:MAG: alcohol dehydrogenase catalytic domain-containing protein [Armatimonadetes bacterium]|nr:alcohol dehydrogenase catalytic domain-containing protein [Armatimonadota bacterium]
MKAAVYGGVGNLTVREVAEPTVPEGGLLVKVKRCLLCGTDLKLYYSGNPRCKPPQIIGHEFAGVVCGKDPTVTDFEIGDRITMATSISCGECRLCRRGLGNLCQNLKCISYDYPGALAEYVPIPAQALKQRNIVKVPDSVTDDAAALAEPLSCVINSQKIAGVGSHDFVVIIGAGPLGLLHLFVARWYDAAKVAIIQRSEARRKTSEEFGPDLSLSASDADLESKIMNATDGRGADVVVVAAPDRSAMERAVGLTAKGGRVCLFASLPMCDSLISIDSRTVHYREIRIVGASDSRPEHVREALDVLDSQMVPVDKLISHRLPLDRVLEGIELMKERRALKICVTFEDEKCQ